MGGLLRCQFFVFSYFRVFVIAFLSRSVAIAQKRTCKLNSTRSGGARLCLERIPQEKNTMSQAATAGEIEIVPLEEDKENHATQPNPPHQNALSRPAGTKPALTVWGYPLRCRISSTFAARICAVAV